MVFTNTSKRLKTQFAEDTQLRCYYL